MAKRRVAILFTILGAAVFVSIVGFVALYLLVGRSPAVPTNATLVLRVGGDLAEVAPADVFGFLRGGGRASTVRSVVDNLHKAKVDARVKAVLLKPTGFASPYWGKVQEIRDAVLDFKKSGKPIYAYLENGGQREYYLANPSKDKLLQYAQKVVSSKGKRDGLYYPTREGEAPSPLGQLYASATAAGYKGDAQGKPIPYHGYYYRVLKAQGPDAKGGAYDYVARGKMIGGFAMVAYPASYGSSGIMTFIVNHDGTVYEKDLGPKSAEIAAKMTKFNPDKSWKRHDTK